MWEYCAGADNAHQDRMNDPRVRAALCELIEEDRALAQGGAFIGVVVALAGAVWLMFMRGKEQIRGVTPISEIPQMRSAKFPTPGLCECSGCVLLVAGLVGSESVAVAGDVDDGAAVQEPVEHGGGDGGVAEDVSPGTWNWHTFDRVETAC